jgi:hypothetical protein
MSFINDNAYISFSKVFFLTPRPSPMDGLLLLTQKPDDPMIPHHPSGPTVMFLLSLRIRAHPHFSLIRSHQSRQKKLLMVSGTLPFRTISGVKIKLL